MALATTDLQIVQVPIRPDRWPDALRRGVGVRGQRRFGLRADQDREACEDPAMIVQLEDGPGLIIGLEMRVEPSLRGVETSFDQAKLAEALSNLLVSGTVRVEGADYDITDAWLYVRAEPPRR